MARNFLGIDHGDRRIGLSYGDELGIAVPIAAAVEPMELDRLEHIAAEIKRRRITDIVVGYPLNMDGTAGPRTEVVDAFIVELEKRFALPVHRTDEGLSSVEADESFSSKKKGRNIRERRQHRATGEQDSRAAAVILQDFLNAQGFGMDFAREDF
ncbi:MAG: Holliday junction resolvase RuvX [Puniceicoccales bacterium]|jgi:putative Holliday junction resolvase|nr:Holliday junction resolvase RuvX [Puniceicoccales bacterium]